MLTIQHVFADTLRSVSVVIAAIVALTIDAVSPEIADSTAAVVVSIIICMSLLPLFRGIAHTWYELQSISREELNVVDDAKIDRGEGTLM